MELKLCSFRASCCSLSLLIVPYGIETLELRLLALEQILLIVPYGIETMYRNQNPYKDLAFNRTLWN